MASQLGLSVSIAAAAVVSACTLDRFGLLVVPDAGNLPVPATGGAPDLASAADPSSVPDSTTAPPVASNDIKPQSPAPTLNDSGGDAPSAPSDASGEAVPPADAGPVSCDFNGTWASRLAIDVNWVPQGLMGAILAPGSGQIEQWIVSTRTTTGQTVTDTAKLCGIALPNFSGTQVAGSETYGIVFPSSTFDSGVLGTFAITGSIAGSGPGASYTSAPSAVLLGLTLSNPTTDSWPATVTTAVDSDKDGKPGVTALVTQGSGYSDVIVDTVVDRADELYVTIRQVTSMSATALDCDTFSGTVTIPQIADSTGTAKYAIDSHIIGCRLDTDAGDCLPVQAAFVDGTQPVFTPSGSTSVTSVRVSSRTTCAAVRQMLP